MTKDDLRLLLPWIIAILTAGLWLGALQNRVANLEQTQRFFHGDTPKE